MCHGVVSLDTFFTRKRHPTRRGRERAEKICVKIYDPMTHGKILPLTPKSLHRSRITLNRRFLAHLAQAGAAHHAPAPPPPSREAATAPMSSHSFLCRSLLRNRRGHATRATRAATPPVPRTQEQISKKTQAKTPASSQAHMTAPNLTPSTPSEQAAGISPHEHEPGLGAIAYRCLFEPPGTSVPGGELHR